jgi:hypothetical protein
MKRNLAIDQYESRKEIWNPFAFCLLVGTSCRNMVIFNLFFQSLKD